MNLLPWNKTKTDGKPAIPHLDDLLAEAAARAADIEGRMQALAFAVADGEEGAVEVLTKARADLREAKEAADMLALAKQEHLMREASKLQQARSKVHAERVNSIRADLVASVKQAETVAFHVKEAVTAFDALAAMRTGARQHNLQLPLWADSYGYDIRRLVAAEIYRVGARLNHVNTNTSGFPGGEFEDGRQQGLPDSITPLVDRIKATNDRVLAELEQQAPQT